MDAKARNVDNIIIMPWKKFLNDLWVDLIIF